MAHSAPMSQYEPTLALAGDACWLRGPVDAWNPGTLDRETLYAQAHARAHDARSFERARRLASEVLAYTDDVQVAKRVVHDTPIYLLLVSCMYLHHRHELGQSDGVTLTALRELFAPGKAPRSFAGDSHLREMLAWVRQCGLLCQAEARDGRVRRYEPTPLLEDMFQRWVQAFQRTDAWDSGLDPSRVPVPPVVLVYRVLSCRIEAFRHGFVPTERFPLIQQHMLRRHGYATFLAMVEAMEPHGDGATAHFSLTTVASRFQVARGTVRAVLGLGAEAGLLAHDSRRSHLTLTPAFVRLAQDWMALEFTYMRDLCRQAAADLAAVPATTITAGVS